MRRSAALAGATAILALTTSLVWPATAGARTSHSLVVVSNTSGMWVNHFGTRTGTAVLTYGNRGCNAVDAAGFCTSGVWPTLDGAHWVWNRRNVTRSHAVAGVRPMNFTWLFSLPDNATNITGSLQITVDNAYRVRLNGAIVGSDGQLDRRGRDESWMSIETYSIRPVSGVNTLRVRAVDYHCTCSMPYDNPAGIIFRADISYEQ
jgi:hypothetical protein